VGGHPALLPAQAPPEAGLSGATPVERVADDGRRLQLFDVVGGDNGALLDALLAMHGEAFAAQTYAHERVLVDAAAPARRDGLVVHQWVLVVEGVPAGFSLSDSNLVRGLAPVNYLAVSEPYRAITVGGRRLAGWLLARSLEQYAEDATRASADLRPGDGTGPASLLGALGEIAPGQAAPFLHWGWRDLAIEYREPVHGWNWRQRGGDTMPMHLLWLPPATMAPQRVEAIAPSLAPHAAAAYLIDMYELDPGLPWVAALVGDAAAAPAPRRRHPGLAASHLDR